MPKSPVSSQTGLIKHFPPAVLEEYNSIAFEAFGAYMRGMRKVCETAEGDAAQVRPSDRLAAMEFLRAHFMKWGDRFATAAGHGVNPFVQDLDAVIESMNREQLNALQQTIRREVASRGEAPALPGAGPGPDASAPA